MAEVGKLAALDRGQSGKVVTCKTIQQGEDFRDWMHRLAPSTYLTKGEAISLPVREALDPHRRKAGEARGKEGRQEGPGEVRLARRLKQRQRQSIGVVDLRRPAMMFLEK